MAREIPLQIIRSTRANLDAAKAAGQLLAGELYLVTDENKVAIGVSAIAYVDVSISSHNALSGLSADDHPQYHTDERGDARYEPKSAAIQTHIASTVNPHNVTAAQTGAYTSAQTDTLLASKAAATHGHAIGDVASLQTALDGKASTAHSHTSTAISDFAEAVDDRVAALLTAGTNVALAYDDAANKLTIAATGGGGGTATRFARGATFVSLSGPLSLPVNDVPLVLAAACTIKSAHIKTLGGTGSCVIDVRRSGTSLCGAAKPTIASGTTYDDTTLTGWTTALAALDTLTIILESVSGALTMVDLTLILEPTT